MSDDTLTPGQAAYEAFLPDGPIAWEYADDEVQKRWEAIAQAALTARAATWTHDPLLDVPPGELAHLLRLVDLSSAGQAAYDAYRPASAGRSLVSGQRLPEWGEQAEDIGQAWQAAAEGVIALLADQLASAVAAPASPSPDCVHCGEAGAGVTIDEHRWYAIVRQGTDGEVVKVIGYRGDSGISCYDSLAEWEAATA